MCKYLYICLFCILTILQSCTHKITKSYLDENGNTISRKEFYNEWSHNAEKGRWDTRKGYTIEAKLTSKPRIERLEGNYQLLSITLEELSHKRYSRNTTFLISYYFKDDLCNPARNSSNNNWQKYSNKLSSYLSSQDQYLDSHY